MTDSGLELNVLIPELSQRIEIDLLNETPLFIGRSGRLVMALEEGSGSFRCTEPIWVVREEATAIKESRGRFDGFVQFEVESPCQGTLELTSEFPWSPTESSESPWLEFGELKCTGAFGGEISRADLPRLSEPFCIDGEIFRSHLNPLELTIKLPSGAERLALHRRYDAFHGLQRARVLIDEQVQGAWFVYRQDRIQRVQESWFGIAIPPDKNPESRSYRTIRLAIDPTPGTNLWSFSTLTVLAQVK